MMSANQNPGSTDPRDTNPAGSRKAMGAVVALGVVMLVIVGLAVYAATSSPRQAEAGPGGGRSSPSTAGVEASKAAAAKYQAEGKFVEAGTILGKLIEVEPTDQQARVAYGQALMGQKRYAEAYAQYEAAVALLPSGTLQRVAESGDPAVAQLHFEAGTCANMAGKLDRAEEHYSMAQTADRREPKYPLYLAMIQLKRGGKENESRAVASLLRATHLNGELGEAWGTLAEIELRNDQLGLAAQHLEKARKLQPDAARWRLVEARMLNRRGEAEQALTLLTALPSVQRTESSVLNVMAESYGLLRRPADAANLFASAFKASAPVNPEFAYQAALWFERAGKMDDATSFARTAMKLGHADAKDLVERLEKKS